MACTSKICTPFMAARAVRQYSGFIAVQWINTFLKSPLASTSNTVGFIGLGNMGKGMAENLVTKVELLEQTSFPLLILRHDIFI